MWVDHGNSATSLATDEHNRLEATTTGTKVTWTNHVNTTTNTAGDLVAGMLAGTSYAAGASSTQTLAGDGAVSFRFRHTPTPRMLVGLNNTDTNTSYPEMGYAIYLSSSRNVAIYENGTRINAPTATTWFTHAEETDLYTIHRDGDTVHYLRNGRVFHTSTKPATGSYVVDTSFIYTDTTLGDVTITTGNSGVTRHTYDTAGQRVLRVDPDGTKTIYLTNTELRWTPGDSTVAAARTYPGGVRRGFNGDITQLVTDHQGTVTATVNAATGVRDFLRYTPHTASVKVLSWLGWVVLRVGRG